MMAIRSAVASLARAYRASATMDGGPARRISRYFSDGKGRILSEEERAVENVYIQKMERERMEKLRLKADKERAAAEKTKASEKTQEEPPRV